jgi:hypothetical protein
MTGAPQSSLSRTVKGAGQPDGMLKFETRSDCVKASRVGTHASAERLLVEAGCAPAGSTTSVTRAALTAVLENAYTISPEYTPGARPAWFTDTVVWPGREEDVRPVTARNGSQSRSSSVDPEAIKGMGCRVGAWTSTVCAAVAAAPTQPRRTGPPVKDPDAVECPSPVR